MKYFVLILCVICPVSALSQSSIKALRDTLQLRSKEFVTPPAFAHTKELPAKSNGAAIALTRNFQFVAGNSPDMQLQGDSAYVNAWLINKSVKVWRNGLFQYTGTTDGVKFDHTTGKIVFYPRLVSGDDVYIEALGGF
ncbi:hypothetical protein [Chitinophaga arvensicola]|uniref:Uncharacterized protein n=1 Tax=Chitinophaga arvensicola TaxID=29529 RepID=A0A1I0S8C5_9BACT|nr:hypothetical protein [Chitinophaga arvensicola]SEW52041.1 hypothetical protein SAMN04488122_4659 [Chitinophaga arvensicola]